MRRFLFWYLPLATSLIAVSVFGYGFASYLRGDTGSPVQIAPESGSEFPGAPREVVAPVILGDSLARGAGDDSGLGIGGRLDVELQRREMPAQRTYNIAVNGARTTDLLALLGRPNVQEVLRGANVIIVSIGGNDLWGGNDWRNAAPPDPDAVMDDVLDRIEAALQQIREVNPAARIFFIGLYNPFSSTPDGTALTPLVSRWNARLLERFGRDPNFTVVQTADLFTHHDRLSADRFHPGGEAYEIIARRIADAL